MKIVIIKKASHERQRLISGQFPADWNVVFVAAKELPKEIEAIKMFYTFMQSVLNFSMRISRESLTEKHQNMS